MRLSATSLAMQAMARPTGPGLMRAQHARSLPQVLSTEVQQLALGAPPLALGSPQTPLGWWARAHACKDPKPSPIDPCIYLSLRPSPRHARPLLPRPFCPNPPDLPQPSCPNLTPTLLPRPSCPNPPCTPSCTALLPRYVRLPYHPRPRHVARPRCIAQSETEGG